MNFGKSLFAKKLLSLFVLITLICPLIKPPVAGAFSFFGFGSSEEETLPVKIETKKNNVIKQDKIIAVLVQSELVQDTVFATAIDRYAKDGALEIGARSIVIPIPKGASVKEIYEGLAHLYFMGDGDDGKSQLVGTVLIGEIPIPVVEKASHLWPTIFPYTDFE